MRNEKSFMGVHNGGRQRVYKKEHGLDVFRSYLT
jgi:hypothetical protein